MFSFNLLICLFALTSAASQRRTLALKELFHVVAGGDNEIDAADLIRWYHSLEVIEDEPSALTAKAAAAAVAALDADADGRVRYDELAARAFSRPRRLRSIDSTYKQIHLAYGDDPTTSMTVMWVTDENRSAAVVDYDGARVAGDVTTYEAGEFGWDGYINTVKLTGLKPDTRYAYAVGDGRTRSPPLEFRTAPLAATAATTPQVYAILADMGTYIPMGWAVLDQLVDDLSSKSPPFSLVLLTGDVCYAGTGKKTSFQRIWDLWEDMVEPVASRVPWMFSVGNHEKYYDFAAYRARFRMPMDGNGYKSNRFWYSFDHGLVHFTQMSTEHNYSVGSEQYRFLDADLAAAAANRRNRPWLVLNGHRPIYSSDKSEWDGHHYGARIQQVIEPLIIKYNVDLYLCGHMHMGEITTPTRNGRAVQPPSKTYVNPGAAVYINQATAGVFLDEEYIDPKPAWSSYRASRWGYGRLSVFNSSHLNYQWLHQDDGAILSEFSIIKQ